MRPVRFGAALAAAALVSALVVSSPAPAHAAVTELYASPGGSGTLCTVSAPCTLAGAQTKVRGMVATATDDIAVNVLGGTYTLSAPLTFGPEDSGQNGHDVIWRAAPGATPLLSGARTVSGWTQYGSTGVWKASVPAGVTDTRQLYVNDERAQRARGPHLPAGFTRTATGYTTTSAASIANWKNHTGIEFVSDAKYNQTRCPVGSVSGTTIVMALPCWNNASLHPNNPTPTVYYVENAYELLDRPGEWYLDRTGAVAGNTTPALYYKPRPGEALTGAGAAKVTVPAVEKLLVVSGLDADHRIHNLQIRGLTFADATWLGPNAVDGYVPIQAGVMMMGPTFPAGETSGWPKTPTAATIAYAENVTFQGNTVTRVGSGGMDVEKSSNNVTLLGNHIHDTSGAGVQVGDIGLEDQRPGSLFGTEKVSASADASFTYTFTGTGVDYLTTMGPDRGEVEVYIDDQLVRTESCYSEGVRPQEICVKHRGLPHASHTVKIVNSGGEKLGLDALRILGPFPFVVANDDNPNITYTGSWGSATGLLRPEDRMHDITLQSNYVHDIGMEYNGTIGIFAGYVDGLKVLHNEVANTPYSAISIGWGWGYQDAQHPRNDWGYATTPTVAANNQVVGNYIHHFALQGSDGAGIYTLGKQPDSIMKDNYIALSPEVSQIHGLYLDNGSQHWTVSSNVVDRTPSWILVSDKWSDPYASNNIVTGNWANGGPKACYCDGRQANQVSNNTESVAGQNWPAAAQTVIDAAGLEQEHRHLRGTDSTQNLALGATAVATSVHSTPYAAAQAVDGSMMTRWSAATTPTSTLTITLPRRTTLNRIVVRESQFGIAWTNAYELQYLNSAETWTSVASGPQFGLVGEVRFPAVTTTAIRLNVVDSVPGTSVAEVEAYHDNNVARGKAATQSSDYTSAFPASRAVDGNTNGALTAGSLSHTNSNANAWWQVDLGRDHRIGDVHIYNRTDAVSERLTDFWVFSSATPFNTGLTAAQQSAVPGVASVHVTGQGGSPTSINLDDAVGRYVMVQLSGTNYLTLAEVQVSATPVLFNLAEGKPAAQSSDFAGYMAGRAVDGNPNGHASALTLSHTNSQANAWWKVDLGALHELAEVKVFNRTDANPERLSNYWLFVSNAPFDTALTPAQQEAVPGVSSWHQTTQAGSPTTIDISGVSGRYVMVQLDGTDYLTLAEVQVLERELVNVAVGAAATQSSNFSSSYFADRAVDGLTDGTLGLGSVTHTNNDANAWWQADLGSTRTIEAVNVFNRTDGASERLSNYWVFISDTPFNTALTPLQQSQVSGVDSWHLTTQAGSPTQVDTAAATGRYVMVQLNGTNYLSLAEVQVLE